MARLIEVLPVRLVAAVVGPLVVGLVLLVATVDLPPVGWAFVYVVVLGGLLLMGLIVAHVYLLEHQQEGGERDADQEYADQFGPE